MPDGGEIGADGPLLNSPRVGVSDGDKIGVTGPIPD